MSPDEQRQFKEMQQQLALLQRKVDGLETNIQPLFDLTVINSAFFHMRSKNANFQLRLPNLSANPAVGYTGALAVVGGKLKVYTGGTWVVVGTQT